MRVDLRGDLHRIWYLTGHDWPLWAVAYIFLLVAEALGTLIRQAVAKTMVVALDRGGAVASAPGGHRALVLAVRHLATLALGYGIMCGLRELAMSVAENRLLILLRRQTFARILQQDVGFHDERTVGELASRLNSDCEAVSLGLSKHLNSLLRSAAQVLFGICYVTYTSWRLSVMLVSVWGVLIAMYALYGRFARRAALIRQDLLAAQNIVATEALQGIRTVRALGAEVTMLGKYQRAYDRLIFIEHQCAAAYGMYAVFFGGFRQGIKAVALGAGGILVAKGAMGPEQLAASMLHVDSMVGSSLEVGNQFQHLVRSIGASRRVFELTVMPPSPTVLLESQGGGRRIPARELRGGVRFRNVTFAYPSRPDFPVLLGLDLELAPGSTTALVGSSSSGKSTVAALLQRWYEPQGGEVLLDGVPLGELDPTWLRSLFGIVTQDPQLFSATVWENVAFGLGSANSTVLRMEARLLDGGGARLARVLAPSKATMLLVREASEAAHAHEFVRTLPDGYNTAVGDARLSGGQRQRLALARALARQPRILVLDEATSALDRKTEAAVQASVGAYLRKRGATCLVITHRLSTVVDADHIVVMDQGRIAEQGTHPSLMRKRGLYSGLVRGEVRAAQIPYRH